MVFFVATQVCFLGDENIFIYWAIVGELIGKGFDFNDAIVHDFESKCPATVFGIIPINIVIMLNHIFFK